MDLGMEYYSAAKTDYGIHINVPEMETSELGGKLIRWSSRYHWRLY